MQCLKDFVLGIMHLSVDFPVYFSPYDLQTHDSYFYSFSELIRSEINDLFFFNSLFLSSQLD